jgi:hypothetical protein
MKMKTRLLSLVFPVILCACGPAGAPASSPEAAPAQPTAIPPAPPVPAALPAGFLGRWAADAAACTVAGHESRLVVSPEELAFHESIGRIRSVVASGDRVADVTADFEGEGETWSRDMRLSLSADDLTLTIQYPDGDDSSRRRCDPA